MKFINSDCKLQDSPCDLGFKLRDGQLVNTVRYQMEYVNAEGRSRNFDLYVPKEVFSEGAIPASVVLRVGCEAE